MIALLPMPISGIQTNQGPVFIIGFTETLALVVSDEGRPSWAALDQLTIDWRFSWKTGSWVDVGPYEELDESDTEEETDVGGEEVSGDLPDADGTDGGDPVDG